MCSDSLSRGDFFYYFPQGIYATEECDGEDTMGLLFKINVMAGDFTISR